MAYLVATPSLSIKTDKTAGVVSTGASGGVGPYTYQWYRDTATPVTPGAGNLVAGATALTLNDSGLIPNTAYYYVLRALDTGNADDPKDSNELAVLTNPQTLSPNQFDLQPLVGKLDMAPNLNDIAVQIDASQTTPLYAGMWVNIVDSTGGIPKVVGCTANTDGALGPINYDVKSRSFNAGDRAEISIAGNCMYLMPTASGARGAQAVMDITSGGGVKPATGATGSTVVGWFPDKPAAGVPCRVMLSTPSFKLDS